ncbi:MAG: AMP-binding protein [Actinomycetota bacterium]
MIPEDVAGEYRRNGWWRDETLADRFDAMCARNAERLALIDQDETLRFEQVADCVESAAAWFASLAEAGGVVSWQLPNWWEAAIVHHAAVRAGCVSNPLNMTWRERELQSVLAEVRPQVLVVTDSWRGFETLEFALQMQADLTIPAVVLVRGIPRPGVWGFEHLLKVPAASAARRPLAADEPCVLLYTSGTTSAPKGVMHTSRGLLCEMDSFPGLHALTPDDRYLGGSPVAHIAGLVYGIMTPFSLGTSTVFLDRWDPARALEAIERDRATFQTGPPTFLQTLAAKSGGTDLRSFRLFSTGGASIPTEAARAAAARLGCVLKRAYGSTELPTLTATTLDDDERARCETDGRAVGGAELRIVSPDGHDLAAGEEGEIWGRAPEMFVGYRDAILDETAFADGGWFKTGDLGVVDADGLLRVTGRLKDVIIRGGENISAPELEGLLATHPAIADVAIVGVPDPRLGERVCAAVVVRPGETLTLADVVEYLRARRISTYKLPERLEIVPAIPKTASGKVAKAQLKASLR